MTTVWTLSNGEKARRLEKAFKNRNIDFSAPAFCDHPNFLKAESANPRFLEAYAEYVEARNYTVQYLEGARRKITIAAEAVRAAIEADGRLGACVDAAGMLGRMLDKLGVWNYVAKACLTIEYPSELELPTTHFYGVDMHHFTAPHAIVVAPPFVVVDVTAKYQAFTHVKQAICVPESVMIESFVPARWDDSDIASPEVALVARHNHGLSLADFLRHQHGHMYEVATKLPARLATSLASNAASLKYILVAVGGSIEPLEGHTGYKPCGRTALEIFNQDVLPKL